MLREWGSTHIAGSPEEVRRETEGLLRLGSEGSYIFAQAEAVEGHVLLENMLAFVERVQAQPAGCACAKHDDHD
jgi:hypothetical protein